MRYLVYILFFIGVFANAQALGYRDVFDNLGAFNNPVDIKFGTSGGQEYMFVVEHRGTVQKMPNEQTTTSKTQVLDLQSTVSYVSGQEAGLLGLACHPDYATNGYVYVYYTQSISSVQNIKIDRFTDTGSAFTAQTNIITIPKTGSVTNASNHNGGAIDFGPDGYLYYAIGDGGGGFDPDNNGQNLNTAFGAMHRIDVDSGSPYSIPAGNPTATTGVDEMIAWGLRNPWKFSFGPDGRIWLGDVGQSAFCEINIIDVGSNYGWDSREGPNPQQSTTLATTPAVDPVFSWAYNSEGNVSITGGYVESGPVSNSEIDGRYVFGDYGSGVIASLDPTTYARNTLFDTSFALSTFGQDAAGNIYFGDYGADNVYIITGEETVPQENTVSVNGYGSFKRDVSTVALNCVSVDLDGSFLVGGNNGTVYRYTGITETLGTANAAINDIHVAPDGTMYIGGDFTQIDGVSADRIASYNGTFSEVGGGLGNNVDEITSIDNTVYIAGAFSTGDGSPGNYIVSWDNTSFSALGSGTNNEIRSVYVDGSTLIVGGNFSLAGGNTALRIATWDGANWGTIGGGTSGFVQAIEKVGTDYFFGGNFTEVGSSISANRIGRYNGSVWDIMGNGVGGVVNAMVYHKGFLYVAGGFDTASDVSGTNKTVNKIARWSEDTGWQALGILTDVGVQGTVNDIAISKGRMFIATTLGGHVYRLGTNQLLSVF